MNIGTLDTRVRIEAPVSTPDPDYGTPVITWTLVAVVWANVRDDPPGPSESLTRGLVVAKKPTTVGMHYRSDVTSAMRLRISGVRPRVLQIIGEPAELGRREWTECKCESVSS